MRDRNGVSFDSMITVCVLLLFFGCDRGAVGSIFRWLCSRPCRSSDCLYCRMFPFE